MNGLANITQAQRDGSWLNIFTMPFDDQNIVAGDTRELSFKNDNGYFFEGWALNGSVWYPSTTSSAIPFTELLEVPSPTIGSNTHNSYAGIRITMQTEIFKFFDKPVRFREIVGSAKNPFYLLQPIVLPPGASMTVKLWNDLSVAVRASLSLVGRRIPLS